MILRSGRVGGPGILTPADPPTEVCMTQELPARARVVVVGGGVVGCAVAYHLTRRGLTDVVLLERATLTSGTTWHAAGLITLARPTEAMRRIVRQSLEVFADLEQQVGIGYRRTGTIHVAATPQRWEELRRQAAAVSVEGITTEALDPDGVAALFPLLDPVGLVGGIHYPQDGRGNATDTTLAMAAAARAAGALVLEKTPVTDVLIREGVVRGVRTDAGEVEAEYVVNCTGMWGRQLAGSHGVRLPLQALEHYYAVTEQIPGLGSGYPTIKSADDCTYVKGEAGKLMVGFFEPGSRPWSPRGIPEDAEFTTMPGEWDHLTPYFEKMIARIPTLAEVGIRLFFCGPESFTPDGTYHLGEVPGVRNYLAAVGFNSVGFLSGPGAGKVVADWIVDGHAPFALVESDPRRTMSFQTNRRYLEARVTETLDLSYGVHWPFEQRTSARGIRRSPLHDRVVDAGAVLAEVAGWERAAWYARDGVDPQDEYTFGRQKWFECVGVEHRAVRSGVGLFDLSSFGKLLVQGPGALELLQRVCANDVAVPPGRIVYTQWLNDRGGIEADVTVTRLQDEQFLVLTAAASTVRDADWLRRCVRAGEPAIVTDVSGAMAMLALMGPRSRELLAGLTDVDLSDAAFPFATSREIDLGLTHVRATRITYVGELGWELLVPTEMAVHVYETLLGVGERFDLVHAGYHALNALRLEKGYRSWGHDIGPDDTPLEAGLAFAVAWDKPGFNGRDALVAQRESGVRRRMVQLLLTDPEAHLYHDEPILRDGVIVGKVTSAMYGHTLGGTVALGYVGADRPVDADWVRAGRYEVDVAGTRFPAAVSLRAMYDPDAERTRG
jgi:4-methylaminobutanoate oxidase (formaldehyde-forming)